MSLPKFLKSFFWSYRFEDLDREKDKNLIILSILNYGNYEAWQWVFKNYPHDQIRQAVQTSTATAWRKPSLYFWQNILEVKAKPWRFANMPRPADWPWPY